MLPSAAKSNLPTIVTHAVAGAAAAQIFAPPALRIPLTIASAICALLPDADTIGFEFGIPYGSMWGHRGISHSLLFAGVLAAACVAIFWSRAAPSDLLRALACIFVATASHGFLDAFTNGGLGVAFFAPFDSTRYFFPVRPIRVSAIGITPFFSSRGAAVLLSEIVWVWIPSGVLALLARVR